MDVKIISEDLKFKLRVSAIFIIDNKILVEKYTEDSYCLPGGYIELGETSQKAMIRELKEETNLDFKIDRFLGSIENFFVNYKNQKTHGIDFYYKVSLINDEDIKLLDFKRVEQDKDGIVNHNFSLLDLNKIDEYKIYPLIIKKELNSNTIFHYIEEDN